MRFSVPQYITIEDKLMGLITFRQLFLLLGAFFISYGALKYAPSIIALVVAIMAFGLAGMLGWMKINGRPLLLALPEVTKFFITQRQYRWRPNTQLTTKEITTPIIQSYLTPLAVNKSSLLNLESQVQWGKEAQPLSIEPSLTKQPQPKSPPPSGGEPVEPPPVRPTVRAKQAPLIQYVHQHSSNPHNPYKHFPLPTFPNRQW